MAHSPIHRLIHTSPGAKARAAQRIRAASVDNVMMEDSIGLPPAGSVARLMTPVLLSAGAADPEEDANSSPLHPVE